MNSRAYVAGLQLQGLRPAEARSASSRAASATACTSRSCCARGGNVLLLDEPTNDLDVDTLRALEEALLAFPGCAVVISHDRWFLDRIATHVLAFEGDSQVRWFEGNFEAYEEHRHERLGAEADRPHRINYKKLDARVAAAHRSMYILGRPRNRSFRASLGGDSGTIDAPPPRAAVKGRRCRRTAFVAALALAATVCRARSGPSRLTTGRACDVFVSALSSGAVQRLLTTAGTLHETINQSAHRPQPLRRRLPAFSIALGVSLHTTAYTVPAIDRFLRTSRRTQPHATAHRCLERRSPSRSASPATGVSSLRSPAPGAPALLHFYRRAARLLASFNPRPPRRPR